MEGDRPNVLQKWRSEGGHGDEQLILLVRDLPQDLTQEERNDFFTEQGARGFSGENGKVLSFKVGKIEQLPLGILHSTLMIQRLDQSFLIRNLVYYFLTEKQLVMLQFGVYSEKGEGYTEKRISVIEPLTKLIVNSVVLPSQYK